MALGTPVIATDFSGNPELIKDEYNGMLFQDGNVKGLAEKIIDLKNDKALREKIINHGKETALNDFSINKTIDNYISHFENLILKK